MVSKNNLKNKMEQTAARTPHYGIRKLSVGVASVLISTTLYMGATTAKADTLPSTATDAATTNPETASSSSSTQTNATVDNTAKTTVPTTASSTDTSVSTTSNAQASTTNTTAGATSSDKSSANNNSLVANNVESTANTTAQTQPKPDVVTSDKANVDNQVGSNVENKSTTTTDTISAPTTPKRVVRSLAATPTTNSKELVENQDYTVSNVSLEDHKKQDNFDEDATFLHADINAKDGDAIANKEITVTFNKKEFNGFRNFKNQGLIYNDQVIGNIVKTQDRTFKIAFNDKTKGFKDINLSLKVYLSDYPYALRDLYTNNQAKNNEKYVTRHNYQIGSTNYYVDRESTIHYVPEQQPTTRTTEQYGKPISYWYSPQEWFPLDITYYTTRDGKTYAKISSIPGKEISYDLGLGKGFITPDTKSVTISFEPSSKYYSRDANKLKISDNATFDEKTVTHKTQYDSNDLVPGTTDVYTTQPKSVDEVSDKHTYYVKDLIKLEGNTLTATDVKTSTGINNLSARWGDGTNGYVGSNDVNYTVVSSDDLRKFVIDNAAKIIETRGEFLTSNSDYSNPGRIVAHNNTTGQDVYYELHNKVKVSDKNVTTPPDGTILISAGKDIPTKVYSYTSTDIPSNVDKSKLTKEVTRTINVHNPNGTVDTTVQTVTYHQTVTVAGDEVVYNNDWVTADNQSWDKVDVPQIEGYKASQTTVNQSWVNVNTQNQTVDITYTANPQSIKINYVDDEKGGVSVKSDTLNGKTDETVKTGITIPENYNVVGTTPSEYTFKANGNTDITVHLKHVIDTTSEEKTVTRTIKVTDPTGKVTTIPQTAKVTRTVSTDKVTNQKTYGDWTTSSFDSYDVPLIEGYTASQSKVDTDTVTSDTQNSEVNISYTANDQAIKINYIDSDNNDSVVKSDTLNGKTDQTVKTGITIPEGYTIEEQVPTDYTFKVSGNTDITVKLKHGTTTVIPDNPKTTADKLPDNPSKNYPSGVGQNDLNKTVTRTIKITDSQGKVTTETQTVHLTRTATVDEVTGDITYGDWSTGSFDSYDVPVIEGYTASQSKVDTATVTSDTQNSEVNITYTANPQSIKINYVDSDNNDSVVKSDTLNGKTDQTVKTNINVPDGYVIEGNVPTDYTFKASGNADITVKLKHGTTTVTPDNPKTTNDKLPDNPSKNYPSGVAESDLNKNVTRTIKVTDPQDKVTTEIQTVHLTRSATVDEVTGKVTYGDWTTGSFDSYDVPVIEGYTATQSKVDTATVTSDTQNSEVNITYTANPQSIKINYVDSDNNDSVVKSDTLNGKTDQTVKTNINIPDGYVVESNVPDDYTFKAKDNADITIKLKHGTITVTPDKPKTTGDKLPDNPNKNYPSGVTENDLNKTITRTIKIADPQGKVTTTTQTVHLTRNATVDEVTGEVTYSDWSTGSFDSYDVPVIEGYTATQSKVDEANVTSDTQNSEVNITYTANPQSIKINYVDSDNNDSVVKSDTLSGKTDQTVKTGITIPDGYVVESNVPNDYTFKAKDNADITIKLKHGTITVTPDKPKTTGDKLPDNPNKNYPSGVAENDLNKTVTRTIKVTDPQGKVTTTTQTVHLTRSATVDEVTGNITYGDWTTGSFDSYDVPSVEGYTASQDKVDTDKVTSDTQNSEVNISYTANDQAIKINYVDSDNNGSVVKSDTLSGKTDQIVKTGITIPDGYVIEGNVPNDYTFKASGNADITVKLKHGTTTVTSDNPRTTADKLPDNPSKNYPNGVDENDLNKTVTRTINMTDPQDKVTTEIQTVHLTRSATVDEVTGDITYGDWSTGSFDGYDVPTIEGYTATQSNVDTAKVTSDTQNSEVNISYTANPQSIKINYVDDDKGGATVKSYTLNGKTDETVKTGITIPENYTVVGTTLSEYTFKAKDNADITVHLKHVIDTKSEEKTITRTIKVTNPNGGVMTIPQSAKSTRTVSTDKVTGEVTYGDWSKADLDGYDVPLIEGYTASQPSVAKTNVDGSNEDNVVEINYTPNKQVISIDYVDNGKVIATQVLTGKTDQTVKTNIQSPDKDKYVLVGNNPESYTFKAKDNADIRVEVKHVINDSTESKDVTRTIIVTRPDGKETTEVQKATVSRTVHTDAVTGAKTYDEWSKATLDKYDVPVVDGYTPSLNVVEGLEVDGNNEDSVVKVGYTANPQSIKVNYVDEDNGSSTVKTETLNGKTDQTVKTGIEIPDGYVVEGQVPTDYTFKAKDNADITVKLKHGTTTVTADNPKTTDDKLPDNPSKSYPSGVGQNDLNKDVTRTIKVTDPTGKVTTETQTVHLTRNATVDEVTENVTYGDWTTGSFNSYDVPSVEGYTASQDKVDTDKVTSDSTNSEVNISYTANNQTAKVVYVDEDNGGSTVKTDILNGKTDETVKTGVKIPDGYVVDGQVPADYTFKAKDNADVTVKLKHGTTTVTPDKPKTANDKLPDNPTKSYPSGVAENDLNKNVTRTIKVTDPTGKVTTETQTVHLTRTATVDEVTGKVSYDDWSTGSFGSYDVPSVDGYTASQVKVDETKVTSDTQNSEVNISYTANNQTAKVVYVDGDNGNSIVKSDTLTGKTDETVKTGVKVPDGYVIEGNIPTDYTFKAGGNTDITVKLKHGTTTVTPDKPKTANDKLPDNPTKSYPSGVAENDLNKDVTRTINVTTPDGKTSTTTQTVHLTRTATVDEVTGKVSYDDWSTGSFGSYDVPSVDGYTASQVKVDETKVTSDSTNNEVNITYTANPQSIKINYVDDDKGGTTVKSDTLNGKTDETVKTGITIPDGYEVEGQVPADYIFKAKDNADITVHLKHEIKTDADYKNVLRTIKVTLPNGKSESLVQVATLSREVKTDKVTNNVSYGSWSSDKFTSYKLPSIEGYTPSLDVVNEAKVDGNTEDSTVEVNYTANKQSAKVVYVDNGKVVATQTLTGKTDQTVKTNIQSPDKDKYVVVGNNPENYTFKAKDNEDIKVEVKHVVNTFKDYKNVIRSIEVTYPNGKTEKLDQVATLERTVHKDAVTGKETYSDWSTENWDSFTAPAINGYTADKDVKETVVTGDTTETTVSIVYTANEQATKIVYVDNDKSGSIVKTDTLNGKTDQTVKTDVKVPDGYVLEGNVPDNYTFTAGDNFDIIVHLRHGIVKVTPDKPKTTADKLPDSSKTYPEGVGQDDLNKTITRTIKVTTPDSKTSTTTQTAHLIRTARVDETTGQVTYDDWNTDSFDSYDVPSVDGYTASQAKVEETKVTSDSQDSEVNISYTANKQSIKVVYVDGDNSGSTVKTDTLTGKTDETVKTGIEIPDGYEVDGQVPSEYSFKAKDNADITVHLKHSTVTVIPDLPKTTEDKLPNNPSKSYPKGVAENDLNKTVVRTIKVTTPDGKTTTTKQTVKLNRVAVVDEVTGQVTYSKWSIGELDRYDVPSIEGYTPSQDRVNMEVATSETKDSVVEISYTPNGQSINITYVDDDKGETTVDSYILAGKTDETVKTGIEIPDGYEVEGQVPTDYTFKAKDNTDITVRLKHKLDKGTETKTVSRIVEITLPDGQTKTIKQEQTLKRSKTTDLVTGDVVYGEWSKAEFDEVVAPEVDGYKPSQAKVEKETVDGNSSDQVVKITYKKVKSDVKVEAKPTVEAKHEAKVQVAPKVEAKASAKPQAKAQPKFVTTELPQTGEKQSKGTTIGAILVGLGSLLGLGALGKRKEK